MPTPLQHGDLARLDPRHPFLRLENPDKQALETPLFDFASSSHQLGARLVWIPANQAFARHIHPNAYHLIQVIEGTAVLEYDYESYTFQVGQYCLVCKGVVHKLGAGEDGLLALVINSPTYENGDPAHVTYLEEEALTSQEILSPPPHTTDS